MAMTMTKLSETKLPASKLLTAKFAAIQMQSGFDLQANLVKATILIEAAVAQGADVAVLPENFAMFSASDFYQLAEQERDKKVLTKFLSALSKKHGIWIFSGSVPMISAEKGKVYSSCMAFNCEGALVSEYKKIHLFDVDVEDNHGRYRESDSISPGEEVCVVDTPFGLVGVAICYDLRFPELFRAMIDQGCNIIVIPSAFTEVTGRKHWELLLRTRAIENQCFVIAANQGGSHVGKTGKVRNTFGHSMIIDADGAILASTTYGEKTIVAELCIETQDELRKNMPVLKHRKIGR